jgi:hypothetical protein
LLLFVGLPGSGKTTARRYAREYLQEIFPLKKLGDYEDYSRLIAMAKNNPQSRVILNDDGTFAIEESERTSVLEELEAAIFVDVEREKADIALVELSRKTYSKLLGRLGKLADTKVAVFYIKSNDELRITRNQIRGAHNPAYRIPSEIMDNFCSEDDWEKCLIPTAVNARQIPNADQTLSALRDEIRLQVQAAFPEELGSIKTPGERGAWTIFVFLLLQLLLFTAVCITIVINRNALSARGILNLGVAGCGGAFGSVAYGMRCLSRYRIKNKVDFEAFKFWYLLRPLEAALLACGVYCIIRGGVAVMGSGFDSTKPAAVFAIAGIAFLVGISTEATVEWLIHISKSVFRDYKIQPSSDANENGKAENE